MLTHHCYVIYSASEKADPVEEFVKEQNFLDVTIIDSENFGINDSRNLIKIAFQQPLNDNSKKLIVVKPKIFTLEAQQALLKILEEPPNTTVFLFLLLNANSVIPTLKSRFLEYKNELVIDNENLNTNFSEFCALDFKDRLSLIAKKMDKDDSEWLRDIKSGLVTMLSDSLTRLTLSQRRSLEMVVMNLGTRGASNKMLLEEMALSIPTNYETLK